MKGLKKIITGLLLLGIGAGASAPIAHNVGFQKGRESAEPIEVRVKEATNSSYGFLEGAFVIDKSGQWTDVYERDVKSKYIYEKRPEDGRLIEKIYK